MVQRYKGGQLVEVSGVKDEGFPGSFVLACVVATVGNDVKVQYMEFLDDGTGQQLAEDIPSSRLRPALPAAAAHYENWEELQVGMCVEHYQDDVWWKGLIIRKTPAGVHVYMPEVDGSTQFIKLLRNLRPGYDWIPAASAPTPSKKQQKQQTGVGYYALRKLPKSQLEQLFDGKFLVKASNRLPEKLPYEPMFSELSALNSLKPDPAAAAAAAPDRDSDYVGLIAAAAATNAATAAGGAEEDPAGQHQEQQGTHMDVYQAMPGVKMEGSLQLQEGVPQQQQQQQQQRQVADPPIAHNAANTSDSDMDDVRVEPKPQRVKAAAVSPQRRSNREGRKRVVYVDGLPVLRDNLYDIKQGEPSVFQKELAAKPYTDRDLPTAPPLSPAAQRRQQQLQHARQQRQQQQLDREDRCLSPAKLLKGSSSGSNRGRSQGKQTAAQKHNAGVKADSKATAQIRATYLSTHLAKLRPFVTPAVTQSLEAAAAAAPQGLLASLPEPPDTQPEQIKGCLREYQLEGVSWLVQQHQRGLNSILADEMGLGKTLQTIAFLAHLKFRLGVSGPHLVVVPLSVMSSWMSELAKWCPELRVVRLHTSDVNEKVRLRTQVLAHPDSFDVAVTTYEMVNSQDFGRPIQTTLRWRYLVLDEGHRIRNQGTLTVAALKKVQTSMVLLLTGTPLQNNMVELYGLLSFLYPDIFTTPGPFEAAFNLSKGQVDTSVLSAAHYLLRPFCLRRVKDEVEVSLPPKVETRIAVPLADQQVFWYRRLLLRNHEALSKLESIVSTNSSDKSKQIVGTGNAWQKLANLLMQLRKVVDHPFLLPNSEPRGEGTSSLQELLDASGKLAVLDRLLSKLKARGHRIVLFSQFTMMMDIIEDYLGQAGYTFVRLDGNVNRVQRMINISQFMKPDSKIFIFLASTRAGGLGLNLQNADTVILYDSDWNPQWDLQATARVHRIGQTKPVHIYRLITSSSVEERMLQRADSKLYLDQMVNRGSTAKAQQLDSLNTAELLSMLSFGADRILANEGGQPPSDAELDSILDRSKHTAKILQVNGSSSTGSPVSAADHDALSRAASSSSDAAGIRSLQLNAASFKPSQPPPSTFTLNGVDYSREAMNKIKREAAAAVAAARAGEVGGGSSNVAMRKLTGHQKQEESVHESLKSIACEYWQQQERRRLELAAEEPGNRIHPERARECSLVTIDGYKVLKKNNYTFQQGGRSAWEETKAGVRPANGGNPPKRKLQKPGRDYAHADTCQVCWDGGDLVCCDVCPAAYHADCLGQDMAALSASTHWACPHHSCASCGRGPAAAGGLLFRCCVCESAWCEDHLPAEHDIMGEWDMFQALGQQHPTNACFITCGPDCRDLAQRLQPTIQHTIDTYEADPELRYKEAVEDDAGIKKATKMAKKSTY